MHTKRHTRTHKTAMTTTAAVTTFVQVLSLVPAAILIAASTTMIFTSTSSTAGTGTGSWSGTGTGAETIPNLPLGDINVVILTDVHSWLGSHRRQEPRFDADLGDVLSFWEQLKKRCSSGPIKKDVFLVNNGDFVDGTGLSESRDGENYPDHLIPLLEKMPYDAVTVGNHELYSRRNIEYMTRPGGYVDWWGDRYLTSNVNRVEETEASATETKEDDDRNRDPARAGARGPLGHRYKILRGEHNGGKLLVFGFLYDMKGYAENAGISVENVRSAVSQEWFHDALHKNEYDAILVLAHMDLVDRCVETIRSAVREAIGQDTPLVFATGHTHRRGFKQLEDRTITFEAGRYLDTVGFVGIPTITAPSTKQQIGGSGSRSGSSSVGEGGGGDDNFDDSKDFDDSSSSSANKIKFGHVYLDANRKVLLEGTLGFSNWEDGITSNGRELSEFIDLTRQKLGLEREIGCAPRTYHTNKHIDAPDSLWGLYRDEVVPTVFPRMARRDLVSAMILSSESWRYDLYNTTTLTVDDVNAVAPFNDTLVDMGTFHCKVIWELNHTLNKKRSYGRVPSYVLIDDDAKPHSCNTPRHLYTHEFNAAQIGSELENIGVPPSKIKFSKTKITSTAIWMEFVEKHWPCSEDESKKNENLGGGTTTAGGNEREEEPFAGFVRKRGS